MGYSCQMCGGAVETREGFVAHMRARHGVTITVEDILFLEGVTPAAQRRAWRIVRMREAWARRRARRGSVVEIAHRA